MSGPDSNFAYGLALGIVLVLIVALYIADRRR